MKQKTAVQKKSTAVSDFLTNQKMILIPSLNKSFVKKLMIAVNMKSAS